MATSSEVWGLTPRKCFAKEDKNVWKWSEKHKLFWSHSFAFAFRILASEIFFFFYFFYIWKDLWWLHSVKKLWMIRKSQISLVALLYFYFRILPSKIVNLDVFLPIEKFRVASFWKGLALITRKYIVEQGRRVSNFSEIFKSLWSHSFFFDLEL